MSRIDFGVAGVDMRETARFGLGAYFSSAAPQRLSETPVTVVLYDPVTGTAATASGTFGNYHLVRLVIRAADDTLLLDWSGIEFIAPQFEAAATGAGLDFSALFGALLAGVDTINGSARSDLLDGGAAGDVLNGLGGDDRLYGGGGIDALSGGAGNDLLTGGADIDSLNGGEGVDTAAFAQPRGDYLIRRLSFGWQVEARVGDEGTDTVSGVESLQFADQTLSLVAPAGQAGAAPPAYRQSGSFLFDPVYYVLANPDLAGVVSTDSAHAHYVSVGAREGRTPTSWFDADDYGRRWSDLAPLNLDDAALFAHFNLYGVWEGRAPGPRFAAFDGARYLYDNPDVAVYVDAHAADFLGSRTNGAIAHFIIYGAAEQRIAYDTSGAPIDPWYAV